MGIFGPLLGPSKDEIWGKIANDIGGSYEDGGFFGRDVLHYHSGQWEITLDTYTVNSGKSSQTFTRMRAPFVNKDGLYFKIYREGVFTAIAKTFGMQEIEIGDTFFDLDFIIRGNNPDKIKHLLADERLKALIRNQPYICFEIKDDEGWFGASFPDGVDELYFECRGIINDESLLRNLFDMFCLTLQRLVEMDSASDSKPNVRL
jgi:hypothetical protein